MYYFSVGEQILINELCENFGISRLEAEDQVIGYKREQIMYYSLRGNEAMVHQLKRELGEI
jgi:hypothetical protein